MRNNLQASAFWNRCACARVEQQYGQENTAAAVREGSGGGGGAGEMMDC